MIVVLSMTMATQYATTKVSYTFGIVHPSNADIRFVGSDNSSDASGRVLRVAGNTSGSQNVVISLGDWMPNSMKNYTAAFAIVNEEGFKVNITFINVSGTGASNISIYLHGNRTTDAASEVTSAKVLSVSAGVSKHTAANCEWILAAGDGDTSTMNGSAIKTPWDTSANVRYNQTTNIFAKNNTRDYVWVQVSISIPSNAPAQAAATGQIWIHFKATTHS
jgi:hypothetical protein